jgi:hypothetical protein
MLPVLGTAHCRAGGEDAASGPGVASRGGPVTGGVNLPDEAWSDPEDARVAKLQIGEAATASCSAVPLAGKWLLSARHCLFAPEPKSSATTYEGGTPTKYPDGAPRFFFNTPTTGGWGVNETGASPRAAGTLLEKSKRQIGKLSVLLPASSFEAIDCR